jgi:hypothetical protein
VKSAIHLHAELAAALKKSRRDAEKMAQIFRAARAVVVT